MLTRPVPTALTPLPLGTVELHDGLAVREYLTVRTDDGASKATRVVEGVDATGQHETAARPVHMEAFDLLRDLDRNIDLDAETAHGKAALICGGSGEYQTAINRAWGATYVPNVRAS